MAASPRPEPNPTVRERMEALGWTLVTCDDTCEATWTKVCPKTRMVSSYYPPEVATWTRDLEACQKAYGYFDGESAYT